MVKDQAVEISRIHKVDNDSKLKAFVDISLCGVVVKGLRIVSGKNGLFLGMPRHQGKDGKWYDTVYPVTPETKQELQDLVLAAYEENKE